MKLPSISKTLVLSTFGIFIAIGLFTSTLYSIDQGETGVILRNGKIIEQAEAGLHMKIPFIDAVVEIDNRTRKVVHKKLQAYTRDAQPIDLDISINYSVKPSNTSQIYAEYRSVEQAYDRIIQPIVFQQAKNTAGQYVATTLIADRTKFINDINELIKQSALNSGITIETVQLENIDFSDAFEQTVEKRMIAQVEVERERQTLEKEKVQADIALTRAKAVADSKKLDADAETYKILSISKAEAESIELKTKALDRAGDNYRLLIQAEKWDGKLPNTMVPGTTIPFLSVK